MVPEQVHAYEFMRRNKVLRFERDSKENENRKERRRTTHVVKGARYGKANECDLQEKRLSHVAAQDGTPRQSLRIACMENNIDKRTVETAKNYLKGKRPHVDGVVESEDAEFVLADFVRNVQSPAIRKDCGTSKGRCMCLRVDGDADVVPKESHDEKWYRFEKHAEHIINEMDQEDTSVDANIGGVQSFDIVESRHDGIDDAARVQGEVVLLLVMRPRESDPAITLGLHKDVDVPGRHEDFDVLGRYEDVDVPGRHEDVDVPRWHEDVHVGIEKPEENAVSIDSVAISHTSVIPNSVDVHAGGQSNDDLPVLPLSSIDPSLLRRYNDLNDTITSARRDSKKDMIAFGTGLGDIPIGKVGQSFWEKGMLMTRLVNFGVSLLIDNFKGSLAIVVPFHICTNIWNGGSIGKPVKLMFSSRSEEHDDEKDMVLFATFDPPNTKEGEIIGHYWVVALNLKENRFEFLDSLNKPGSDEANKVFRRMVKNIKRAWKEGSDSCDKPLSPPTLVGFSLKHMLVTLHPNGHDCGFYMFQFLQTLDGVYVAQFKGQHIGYIRKSMSYSCLTSTKCSLDLSSLLIFKDKDDRDDSIVEKGLR
ncbi:hypothetical protein D1007_05133 [Hordeum vulgare]|nr:hypothetical protein D1007_05133 [Hordeum vulgare]